MKNIKRNRCSNCKEYSSFILLFTFIWIGLFNVGKGQENENLYPAWFVTAPKGAVTAVGYAPISYYPENGIKMARENALLNLAKVLRTTVIGEEASILSGGEHFYAGNTFKEYPDSFIVDYLKNAIVYLDTAIVQNMILVLASDSRLVVDKTLKTLPDNPAWITTLPSDSLGIYSVGISQKYFYETNSWLNAEQNMRLQMAMILKTEVKDLVKNYSPFYQEVQQSKVESILINCQVVARARKGDIFYVLGKLY